MITGALGSISFAKQDQIVSGTPSSTTLSVLATTFNLNAHEYAEVVVKFTAIGPFGWGLWVMSGDASVLGLAGGNVDSNWRNSYTFKAIVRANSTGQVNLTLHTQTSSDPFCTISDGMILARVVARETV